MSVTNIANLWTPDIWIPAIREVLATRPSLFTSGAVAQNGQLNALASGPGTVVNMPFFTDPTDTDDEIQVESTDVNVGNIASSKMIGVICNRQHAKGATALSAAVSGEDPIGEVTASLGMTRLKQRHKTALALLRGVLGTGTEAANSANGCLRANRFDYFDEDGTDADDSQMMDVDKFIDAKSAMGELADTLANGALFVHPTVLGGLEKQDITAFSIKSQGPYTIRTYRGIPIVLSESLRRAGTTAGYVYETFLLANGSLGYGEKPQQGDVQDVASLQIDLNRYKNDQVVIDRTRFVMHPNGCRWGGTPGGQSPTNAELQTCSNWTFVFSTTNRSGMVAIRTNG